MVRTAATTAGSEADVGRLLRDVGLAARPRYDRVGGMAWSAKAITGQVSATGASRRASAVPATSRSRAEGGA